jgi:TolC family type I secretion outer membrane protein
MTIALAVALLATPARAAAQVRAISLDDALELALRANPTMVQARSQLDVAHASRREAWGGWLPDLSGSSSWSRNSSDRFDPTTQRTISAASTSYSAGLTASLELFDGFRRVAENRSATADVDAAESGVLNQRFQVILQTKQAFFNALAADDLVRVAETQIQRATEQLKIARDKLAAGSATRSDTLRGRVELGNAELAMLNAGTQRATAEANLARLTGVDGILRAVGDSSLFEDVALDTAELRQAALVNSPTVGQAEADARAAQAAVGVSRAQYFPSITARYNTDWSGQELGDLGGSWGLRVSLSWPLFNGFTRESNLARSNANRQAAYAQAEDARRLVNAQLTQRLAELAAARQRLDIGRASLAAAREDLRVQQERYRLGAATILEVLTSQVTLTQAEVDIVEARLDFLVAKAQIEALAGREL